MQSLVHYSFHFLVPGVIAFVFFPQDWLLVWGIFIATMAVDLDHLLARPIFDKNRCSIGFHPLHSYPAIAGYALLLLVPHVYVQLVAFGLLLHMYTDWQDCLFTAWAQKKSTGAKS